MYLFKKLLHMPNLPRVAIDRTLQVLLVVKDWIRCLYQCLYSAQDYF